MVGWPVPDSLRRVRSSPEEVGVLAKAGADFVAIGGGIWDDPRGTAAAVAEASRLLAPEPA